MQISSPSPSINGFSYSTGDLIGPLDGVSGTVLEKAKFKIWLDSLVIFRKLGEWVVS